MRSGRGVGRRDLKALGAVLLGWPQGVGLRPGRLQLPPHTPLPHLVLSVHADRSRRQGSSKGLDPKVTIVRGARGGGVTPREGLTHRRPVRRAQLMHQAGKGDLADERPIGLPQ